MVRQAIETQVGALLIRVTELEVQLQLANAEIARLTAANAEPAE